jgi:predicted histidine transporter YuiF (NhaC family)
MQPINRNPHTTKDLIIGYMGAFLSLAAKAADMLYTAIPYVTGLLLTLYAIYNQHQQARINRMKIKRYQQEKNTKIDDHDS